MNLLGKLKEEARNAFIGLVLPDEDILEALTYIGKPRIESLADGIYERVKNQGRRVRRRAVSQAINQLEIPPLAKKGAKRYINKLIDSKLS